MKFEKLNESNGKVSRVFLYGLITGVGFLVIFNLFLTKAKYKVVDSAKLVNSTINYSNADLNVIAMYKNDGEKDELIKEVPEGYYDIDEEKSYCKVPDSDNPIKNKISYDGKEVNIKITQKGTKCYVYFISSAAKTLANLNKVSKGDIGSIVGPSCTEEKEKCSEDNNVKNMKQNGVYYAGEDDDGESYIFRGTVSDNWVKFAEHYWRIIRINGDGSLRLIYSGKDEPSTTGDDTQIGTSAFNENFNDNTYVGYYYGNANQDNYKNTHSNSNPSTIANVLNDWYMTNIEEKNLSNYIELNAGFCNDRLLSTNNHGNSKYINVGYGKELTIYGAYDRFLESNNFNWATIQNPILKCPQINQDLFTVNDAKKGNHKLQYPVGLITADEFVLAGAYVNQKNIDYWLYTGLHYWTMSPIRMNDIRNGQADVFMIHDYGLFNGYVVSEVFGVRPVINLKAALKFEGIGTTSSPFEISE